ncbi:hypothetical protein KV201_21240 [Shewanella sp. SR1]|nr:FCD domain-containing protein [Shewanella sp. SR1]MCB2384666.1 hypothetical protein [Shewanella sp. SR1]
MKHISCQVLTEQIAGLTNNRFLTGLFQSLVQVATANVKEERHSYTISMQFNTKGLELIEAIAQRDENMAEMAMSQMLRSYFDDR